MILMPVESLSPQDVFTPQYWATESIKFDGEMDIEVTAMSVTKAVYAASLRRTHLYGQISALSCVSVAAMMVACFADQVCPGDRLAGAGDLLASAAARAGRVAVSVRRSVLWGRGVAEAAEAILRARDREAAIALLVDIMLLVPKVLS